jgi:hypothetical protein
MAQLQQQQAAAALRQRHQLLKRLSAAQDISVFRDKWGKVKQLHEQNLPGSEETMILCAAALSNGLKKLQRYLDSSSSNLDLPEKAACCILGGLYPIFLMCWHAFDFKPRYHRGAAAATRSPGGSIRCAGCA